MRTTLVLDDQLLEEVLLLSGERTKRAAVEAAMRDFVRRGKARKLLGLEGRVDLTQTVEDLIRRRRADVPRR